jgi:hypothetical protein
MMNYTNDYLLREIEDKLVLEAQLDRIKHIIELTEITPELRFNMIREVINPQ